MQASILDLEKSENKKNRRMILKKKRKRKKEKLVKVRKNKERELLREATVKIRFERIKRVIVEMLLDNGTTVL